MNLAEKEKSINDSFILILSKQCSQMEHGIALNKTVFMNKPIQIIYSRTMLQWGKNLENLSSILCHLPSCSLLTGSISWLNNGFLKSVFFRKKIIRYMAKHQEQFWIVKPPNLFCGMGIRVVNKFLDIPNKKSQLCVQNYIRKQEITCDENT